LKRATIKTQLPLDARLVSFEDLSERWGLNIVVVRRKVKASEIPMIRLSGTTVRMRMSDILAFEQSCVANAPTEEQSRRADEMHRALAAKRRLAKEAR
jgi:hypothetical protein